MTTKHHLIVAAMAVAACLSMNVQRDEKSSGHDARER